MLLAAMVAVAALMMAAAPAFADDNEHPGGGPCSGGSNRDEPCGNEVPGCKNEGAAEHNPHCIPEENNGNDHNGNDHNNNNNNNNNNNAAHDQYTSHRTLENAVIKETIPNKGLLANTGGMPLAGVALLALAMVGLGISVLRSAIRRDR